MNARRTNFTIQKLLKITFVIIVFFQLVVMSSVIMNVHTSDFCEVITESSQTYKNKNSQSIFHEYENEEETEDRDSDLYKYYSFYKIQSNVKIKAVHFVQWFNRIDIHTSSERGPPRV